jgi:uncharacterized membrane protein
MNIVRTIDAPIELVFQTVADIENFSKAVPHITKVEFLTESRFGLGTRFRETRMMQGKEASTELEGNEFEENARIRLVADSHGTVWDSLFAVEREGEKVALTLTMEAKAYKLISKIMNLFIAGFVQKAVEQDMDAVKEYCEQQSAAPNG